MRLEDLDDDQKDELREKLVFDRIQEEEGRWPTWGELADSHGSVTDEELEEKFGGYDFVPDDFWEEEEP